VRRKAAIALAAVAAIVGGAALVLSHGRGSDPAPSQSPGAVGAPASKAVVAPPRASAAARHRGHRVHGARVARRRGSIDRRHVLVRFRAGTSRAARAAIVLRLGASVANVLGPERVAVLRLPRGRAVEAALEHLRRHGAVEFAEPNRVYTIDAVPDDPGFGSLWGLDNTGQANGLADADMDVPEAWDRLGLGGAGGVWPTGAFAVGVIDSGIDANHEDLAGKVAGSCSSALVGTGQLTPGCVDDNGHGTLVSGTIAATGNNSAGVVGMAPQSRVYPCKALDSTGSGYDIDIAACVNEIVAHRSTDNIRVISMSFGDYSTSSALSSAVEYAWQNGILVIAAAGNEKIGTEYPAGYLHAVSVAATDRRDAHASFSNVNPDVEIAAPGVEITSTVPTYPTSDLWNLDGYAAADGTSLSTPYVAAVAAMIAARTGKTGQALRDVLDSSVDDLGPAGRDQQFGFGRINACLALGGSCKYRGKSTSKTPTPHAYRPAQYQIVQGKVWSGRGALSRLFADDAQRLQIAGEHPGSQYVSDFYATVSATRPASLTRIRVDYDGNVTRAASSLRLLLYNWSSKSWTTVYSKSSAWTSDRGVQWSTTSAPARFVSATGAVRLRVQAKSGASVRTRTDLTRVTLTY
jgi:Subtilase family